MRPKAELLIPPVAQADGNAVEVVRAWIAEKALHCTLEIGVWKDPASWGIVLADLARHVANAHHESEGRDVQESLTRIREAFEAEFDHPTDEPSGHFA